MIFCFVRETKQMTLEELDRKCYPTGFMFSLLNNKVYRGIFRPYKGLSLVRNESLAALHRETTYPAEKCPEASASHREGRSSKCVGDIPVSTGVCQFQSILSNSPVQNALLDSLSRVLEDGNRRPVEVVKCGGWRRLLDVGVLRQKRDEFQAKENLSLKSCVVFWPLSVYTLGNELQSETMEIKLAERKPDSLTPQLHLQALTPPSELLCCWQRVQPHRPDT